MKKNSVEIRAAIDAAKVRAKEIIDLAKTEIRELTEDEEKEINELKDTIEEKKAELKELEEELKSYDDLIEDDEDEKEEKNNKRNKMKKENLSLVKEIRGAMGNGANKSFTVNAETRAVTVTGAQGVHDEVVETEIQGILDPLYANSVLSKLGVRWYTGLPMGDVQVPIMGKGTVGWADEIAAAQAANYAFTTVKLSPKRLTAYVDISKQLLVQDTIGVENAIRRDIVNALNDKLEATVLGGAQGTTNQPAGIFADVTPETVDTYAELCQFESELDDANINGQKKYLLGNGAKATFRSTIKGTNATGMIMEGDSIDGTPAITTSNVNGGAEGKYDFAFGDWNYLALGSWGNIEITVDEYTQAVNGCVRLIINAYFDAVKLRPEAFIFGKVTGPQGS